MNSKPKAPRGKSFPPGNKLGGRKTGSKNKSTIAYMELKTEREGAIKTILDDLFLRAKKGDDFAINKILDRYAPIPKSRHKASFIMDIPSFPSNQEERQELRKEIVIKAARGDFSLEEGQLLLDLLGTVTAEEVNNKLELMHDAIVNRSQESLEKLKLLPLNFPPKEK